MRKRKFETTAKVLRSCKVPGGWILECEPEQGLPPGTSVSRNGFADMLWKLHHCEEHADEC